MTADSPKQEVDSWRTVPNLITVLRLLLIVPFSYYAVEGRDFRALVIFFVAGVSDTIDGTLARWLKQTSKLGRLVDPLVDKLLTGIAYVVLSLYRDGRSAIPVWVIALVICRDVIILAGCGIVYAMAHTTAFKPTVYGKLNTFLELLTVGWFLTANVFPMVSPALPVLYLLTAVSIVVSTIGYARQGVEMVRSARTRA